MIHLNLYCLDNDVSASVITTLDARLSLHDKDQTEHRRNETFRRISPPREALLAHADRMRNHREPRQPEIFPEEITAHTARPIHRVGGKWLLRAAWQEARHPPTPGEKPYTKKP